MSKNYKQLFYCNTGIFCQAYINEGGIDIGVCMPQSCSNADMTSAWNGGK